MTDAVAPAYVKHLTRDELTALLAFFKSPLGQRMRQVQSLIVIESRAIGKELIQARRAELLEVLQAELRKAFPQ